jgi:dihydroflavonol-4-reductase
MARYWVGGATGFLGSWLVRELVEGGHEVVAVSSRGGEASGVEVKVCDVTDRDAVAESAAGCDGAFVAVGKVSRDPADAEALYHLHVRGTASVMAGLRAAAVRRVVFTSTSGTVAVGEDEDRVFSEADSAPLRLIGRWPYYRTKLYAEREALAAHAPGEMEVVVVNPSLLLGPGDLRESSTGDVRRFLEGEIPAVPSGGIAFVDVRDAARGLVSAMERGRGGERYLLSGANMTLSTYLSRLSRSSGVARPWLRMPRGRGVAVGAHRAMDKLFGLVGRKPGLDEASVEMAQCYWYCDSSKAIQELGFRPRDPGDTLRDTVSDLVERGAAFPKASSPA